MSCRWCLHCFCSVPEQYSSGLGIELHLRCTTTHCAHNMTQHEDFVWPRRIACSFCPAFSMQSAALRSAQRMDFWLSQLLTSPEAGSPVVTADIPPLLLRLESH